MFKWLSYGSTKDFYKREFSFTVDGIYMRYNAFKNDKEFKESILKKVPQKIDIGCVFTVSVSFFV